MDNNMSSKEQIHREEKTTSGSGWAHSGTQKSDAHSRQHPVPSMSHRSGTESPLLTARRVVQQQRTIGNQAIGRLLVEQKQPDNRVSDGNKTSLPSQLKNGIEKLSGYSMDDVTVHCNSEKPAQLQAHAFTQGTDIHVAPNQEKHLPHEAWHVVQQMQGRVQARMEAGGLRINDDVSLEREADVMGAQAMQSERHVSEAVEKSASQISEPLQRIKKELHVVSGSPYEKPIQFVRSLIVKRIANGGDLYEGLDGQGPPSLQHNQGLTWWGPRATAQEYANNGGTMWHSTATRALNLIDMNTAKNLAKTIRETIRRSGNQVSPALQGVLNAHDFAYAVPRAVADAAQMCLEYANAQVANQNGQWTQNIFVNQVDIDNALQNVQAANEIPLWVGSVIQQFADHGSANAVNLNDAQFLANPDNYVVLRKDDTARDAGFAEALLADLNQQGMAGDFHGLHVPRGMKFGGFTDTKHEIVIRNSGVNLSQPVAEQPGTPDLRVTNKRLMVDDSRLARVWRWFRLNN